MSLFHCSRSSELTAALRAGHDSSAWEPSLREHVESCRHCSDLLLVTRSLHSARAESMQVAPLASPSLLWWRAQLRRRNHALQRISQPTSWFGKLALTITLFVASGLLLWQRHESAEWFRWLSDVNSKSLHMETFWSSVSAWNSPMLIFTLGALVFLGGFVVYLASEKS